MSSHKGCILSQTKSDLFFCYLLLFSKMSQEWISRIMEGDEDIDQLCEVFVCKCVNEHVCVCVFVFQCL